MALLHQFSPELELSHFGRRSTSDIAGHDLRRFPSDSLGPVVREARICHAIDLAVGAQAATVRALEQRQKPFFERQFAESVALVRQEWLSHAEVSFFLLLNFGKVSNTAEAKSHKLEK